MVDILAIGVHPDDVELGCSGTILKQISLGNSVGVIDLTGGELGTRGNKDLRLKESENASKVLGVRFRINLHMRDGFFTVDEHHIKLLATQLRLYKPKVVLANAITDRHPDHGRASKLISEACFYSGLSKIRLTFDGNDLEAYRPIAVYHYIQDRYIHPDFVVDITDFMDLKLKSIMAFSSQFYNPESNEPETPISSLDFIEFVRARARDFGRIIGVSYGEGFTVERAPGVRNLLDLY